MTAAEWYIRSGDSCVRSSTAAKTEPRREYPSGESQDGRPPRPGAPDQQTGAQHPGRDHHETTFDDAAISKGKRAARSAYGAVQCVPRCPVPSKFEHVPSNFEWSGSLSFFNVAALAGG